MCWGNDVPHSWYPSREVAAVRRSDMYWCKFFVPCADRRPDFGTGVRGLRWPDSSAVSSLQANGWRCAGSVIVIISDAGWRVDGK
jgi:hypothetical protein